MLSLLYVNSYWMTLQIRDEMRICLYYAYLYRICVQLQSVDFSQIDEVSSLSECYRQVIKEYKIHKDIYSYLYNIFMPLLYKFDEEDEGFDDSPSLQIFYCPFILYFSGSCLQAYLLFKNIMIDDLLLIFLFF